jgi:hypothetical protein
LGNLDGSGGLIEDMLLTVAGLTLGKTQMVTGGLEKEDGEVVCFQDMINGFGIG